LSVSGGHGQNDSLACTQHLFPTPLDRQRDEPALPTISTYIICAQAHIQHIVRCFSQFGRGTITIGVETKKRVSTISMYTYPCRTYKHTHPPSCPSVHIYTLYKITHTYTCLYIFIYVCMCTPTNISGRVYKSLCPLERGIEGWGVATVPRRIYLPGNGKIAQLRTKRTRRKLLSHW